MDDTTRAIIERITLRSQQPMHIADGKSSNVFYNCVLLTPNELARLAAQATGDLGEDAFDVAIGIAYAGIFFAAAIAGGRQVGILKMSGEILGPSLEGQRVVLVDDVVHSGRRILQAENLLVKSGAQVVGYACIVDRSNGGFGSQAKPLWSAFQTDLA